MRNRFDNPADRRPRWCFVETKKPFLGDAEGQIITHAQLEGAVWSALANEARGVAYFQHNGFYPPDSPTVDPNTGSTPTGEVYSLVDGQQTYKDAVTALNARIVALAPVLNTQSYVWDFDAAGVDTMLKAHGGYAYIFASVGVAAATGSKTFTLPPDLAGAATATVVNDPAA